MADDSSQPDTNTEDQDNKSESESVGELSSDSTNTSPPQPVAAPKPKAKQQIPGYQILCKLGSGSMASVYKALQLSLNRHVAIKILPKKLSEDPEYVKRFYSEGMAAAKLNHPNIVAAVDVGEHDGFHYFVMEYVEGKTVDQIIKQKKRYSDTDALHVGIQVAQALKHAHDQGLIHRDVKPKNIMITNEGVVKLMDLGLARAADDADAIKSESGRLFGTPYYISPEQIVGDESVDFKCDIYSLGATLYYMVTGQVPFDAEDGKQVMIKHVKEMPKSPDRINMDISFGLCKAILVMMAKKKENRYSSTNAMIEDLQSIDFLLEVGEEDKTPHIPLASTAVENKNKEIVRDTATTPKSHLNNISKSNLHPDEPVIVEKSNNALIYLALGLGLSVLLNLILAALVILG